MEIYPELQVCEEIAEWAQAAEDIEPAKQFAVDKALAIEEKLLCDDFLCSLYVLLDRANIGAADKDKLEKEIELLQSEINNKMSRIKDKLDLLKEI